MEAFYLNELLDISIAQCFLRGVKPETVSRYHYAAKQ